MSFHMDAVGTKKAVIKTITESLDGGDTKIHAAVKTALLSVIDSFPDDPRVLLTMTAAGSHWYPTDDPNYVPYLQLSISVNTMTLAKE